LIINGKACQPEVQLNPNELTNHCPCNLILRCIGI